jgi:hypothetical protein
MEAWAQCDEHHLPAIPPYCHFLLLSAYNEKNN